MNHLEAKKILDANITRTIGCTDIGVVGYIASIGAFVLKDKKITHIDLIMSEELYKNSVNVGIPGLKKSGLKQALALGVLLKNPKKRLSLFESISKDDLVKFEKLLNEIQINISHQKFSDTVLYLSLVMTSSEDDLAKVIIKDDYEHVDMVTLNGKSLNLFEKKSLKQKINRYHISSYDEIFDFVNQGQFEQLDELFLIANAQYRLARREMKKSCPQNLSEHIKIDQTICPLNVSYSLKEHIEILSKKRMIGEIVTIYGVAGSGNLGIGTLITPMFLSDVYKLSLDDQRKLIVLSFLTSVYIKQDMKIVTVLCGTGHATGAGSAACYALSQGGNLDQIKAAINLYLSSSMGFICDGAKVSCTYKVSFAGMNGIISAHMVMNQSNYCDGLGLNKMNLDETIKNLCKLNNDILNQANRGIISLI